MLNFKKTITVCKTCCQLVISLTLLLMFCWLGNLYAQIEGDFPPERELDPRHPRVPGEIGGQAARATAISENVEFVGATGGTVYDVFVQDNYAYICAGVYLVTLDVSAPSNPTDVGAVALPDMAYGVYVQDSFAYVADGSSGLRIIDVSSPSSPREEV